MPRPPPGGVRGVPRAKEAEAAAVLRAEEAATNLQPVQCQLRARCDILEDGGEAPLLRLRQLEVSRRPGTTAVHRLVTGPQRLNGLLGDHELGLAGGGPICCLEAPAEAAAGREVELGPVAHPARRKQSALCGTLDALLSAVPTNCDAVLNERPLGVGIAVEGVEVPLKHCKGLHVDLSWLRRASTCGYLPSGPRPQGRRGSCLPFYLIVPPRLTVAALRDRRRGRPALSRLCLRRTCSGGGLRRALRRDLRRISGPLLVPDLLRLRGVPAAVAPALPTPGRPASMRRALLLPGVPAATPPARLPPGRHVSDAVRTQRHPKWGAAKRSRKGRLRDRGRVATAPGTPWDPRPLAPGRGLQAGL